MKTKITTLIMCCFMATSIYGQSCVDLTLSLPVFGGELELDPLDFITDADGSANYTITPAAVDCDDVGEINVTISDDDGFSCTAVLTVVDDVAPVAVVEPSIVATLGADGTLTIFPENVDDGSYDNCTAVTLELSQDSFTCDDLGTNMVFLTVTDAYGNTNSAISELIIEDNLAPIVIVNQNLFVSFDNNGEATLTIDMVEEGSGSYDNCEELFKTLSQSEFDCSDAGTQIVTLTVEDSAGNSASANISVTFEDKLAPVPVAVANTTVQLSSNPNSSTPSVQVHPEDIDFGSYDNCGITQMTLSQDLFTCADIGENTVIFTVYDAAGNSDFAEVLITIENATTSTPNIACNDMTLYDVIDIPVTVTVDDIIEGGPYGCANDFVLTIEDPNGNLIPNNYIDESSIGQSLIATITDWTTGNSCWSYINVEDASGCAWDTTGNITWPLPLIEVSLMDVDVQELTPTYLNEVVGLPLSDVYPTFNLPEGCEVVAVAWEDVYITSQFGVDKIVRTFTVVDWINFDQGTSAGVYTYNHLIKNYTNGTSFICDTLPRSAPVGDCDSGHTLDDDVEWPDDLFISDPRISPDELINFSGVDPLDAQPSFYGEEADEYAATYEDILVGLTTEIITLDRVWSVSYDGVTNSDWSYAQRLEIDFSDFSSLVTVNTATNRAVPEVDLAAGIMTNDQGIAFVDEGTSINPSLSDFPENGLDLADILLARKHVLGQIQLTEAQVLAADINQNGALTTLDLVLMTKIVAGEGSGEAAWRFLETATLPEAAQPRAQYIAYKMGDVNDNALLPGESLNYEEGNTSYTDILLNDGESYEVPFYSDAMIMSQGAEMYFTYDEDIITIEDVESSLYTTDVYWTAEDGKLSIIAVDAENAYWLDGNQSLFEIVITANENGILHDHLKFDETKRSYLVDENNELYLVNGEVANEIGTGTNNPLFAEAISIYPNPTSGILSVDIDEQIIDEDYTIHIYDAIGNKQLSRSNISTIDMSTLSNGMYTIQVTSGNNFYSHLIMKVD